MDRQMDRLVDKTQGRKGGLYFYSRLQSELKLVTYPPCAMTSPFFIMGILICSTRAELFLLQQCLEGTIEVGGDFISCAVAVPCPKETVYKVDGGQIEVQRGHCLAQGHTASQWQSWDLAQFFHTPVL